MFLSTHYRSEMDFTDKGLRAAEAGLRRLYHTLDSLEEAMEHSVTRRLTKAEKKIEKEAEKFKFEFVEAMDEDFNTPRALAALFDLSREINRFLGKQKKASIELLKEIYEVLLERGKVLGLFQKERAKKPSEKLVNDLVELLVELRENLRRKGEFELSDEIRAKLKEAGVVLEDTSEGSKWKLT